MRLVCIFFLFFLSLQAHNLKLFSLQAPQEDPTHFHIRAYFYKNSPCQKCEVLIFQNDKQIAKMLSDENGYFDIPFSLKATKILVLGGAGHQKELLFDMKYPKNFTEDKYPFWLKILVAIFCIGVLFKGLFWLKKTR